MHMRGILRELTDAGDNVHKRIRAIWHYAHSWLYVDNKSDVQKATTDLYNALSESYALSMDDLVSFTDMYSRALMFYCEEKTQKASEEFTNLLSNIEHSNLVPLTDRIYKYRLAHNKPVYVARAKENEYFIAANGKLRRNFLYFDAWLQSDRDYLIDFYKTAIKESLDRGYLVFIQKEMGPHGPIKLKNDLTDIFKDFGVVRIENGVNQEPIEEKECETKDYCILYDLLLSGAGIKTYESKMTNYNPDFRLKKNIVLYNELPKSEDFVLEKTISLIDYEEYKKLLIDYPMSYTSVKREPSALEDFMFALGSSLGFGDVVLGSKFENFTRSVKDRINVKKYASYR